METNNQKNDQNIIPNDADKQQKGVNVPILRFSEFFNFWKNKAIIDIGKVITGNTPPTKNSSYYGDSFNWAGPSDLGMSKYINDTKVKLSNDGMLVSRVIPKNSILVTCIGSTIGKMGISTKAMATNQQINSIIVNTKFNFEFIYYEILYSFKKYLKTIEVQAVPIISKSAFEKLKIYVPSIDEQHKLAKFLTLIDQRIDTQSKIIEDLELCKKKICYEIFSAKESYVKPLGSIISYGKAGGTPASTNKSYYNGNIPFLSISDMTEQGKYILKTEKTLSELGLKNSSAWLVPKNSLILSMYASVGLVSISKVELATSQAMFSMIIEDKNLLEYVYYYLNYFKSFKIHRLLETGTQSNINAEMVKNINIPFFDQTKNLLITQFFNNFDLKIKKEKDILELYKKQKAYLLKNMFI